MHAKSYFRIVITVFLPLTSGFFLTSVFRTINAVQAPALVHSLQLTALDLGLLSAAYFIAYGLFQIPLGLLLDRFGARKVQALLLLVAALAVLLFAVASDITELVISRLLVGVGVAAGLTAGFKANAQWFPKKKLALVNSLMMAFGGLGAVIATSPAQWVIEHIGWRHMNLWFSLLIFLLAILVFLVVPEAKYGIEKENIVSFRDTMDELLIVLKSRFFWGVVPLLATTSGFFVAFEGLWAGTWLRDVVGLPHHVAAFYLFIYAIALICGVILVAIIGHNAERWQISLLKITMIGFVLTAIIEILLLSNIFPHALVIWFAYGCIAQILTLVFTIVSKFFPASQTGRATTGAILLLFLTAFLMQYGIGFILKSWQVLPNGSYPIIAYQISLGACILLQLLAFIWLIWSIKNGSVTTDQ